VNRPPASKAFHTKSQSRKVAKKAKQLFSFSFSGSAQSKDSLQSAQLQKTGRDDNGGSPLFATGDDGLQICRSGWIRRL